MYVHRFDSRLCWHSCRLLDNSHVRFSLVFCHGLQVEFWSGGTSLFQSFRACNLQRIVSLDPDGFSKHLIYHSANNKQRQLAQQKKSERFVKVDTLLGQLNTVKKNAQEAKRRELAEP